MTSSVARRTQHVFNKVSRVPDLLHENGPIVSLYTDSEQILHMQCRLRHSGMLVLFPVTFRLVNAYLLGERTLAETVANAPCGELLLVTRAHNILELNKETFDYSQLSFAHQRYPTIGYCKVAPVKEIRELLSSCMRA